MKTSKETKQAPVLDKQKIILNALLQNDRKKIFLSSAARSPRQELHARLSKKET